MAIDNITVEKARKNDMVDFLGRHSGFRFKQHNGSYRCIEHPSLAIKNDRLSWYWHSKSIGGYGCLDYLIKIENMAFPEAVNIAIGTSPTVPAIYRQETLKPKTLVLPERTSFPMKLYNYLCNRRRIDGEIVQSLVQKGTIFEDKRGNVVFLGLDEHGKPRFASLRSTYSDYRGDCLGSDKRYAFCLESPHSDQLYVFESPIDTLSRASMENLFRNDSEAWKRKNFLSLAGTSDTAMPFFLNKHPGLKEIVFCLDNDPPGQDAAAALSRKYADMEYHVRTEPPYHKDYGEDLIRFAQGFSKKKSLKNTVNLHSNMSI